MDNSIKPTSEKDEYILEDKDFLLIQAIRDLTKEIKQSNFKQK